MSDYLYDLMNLSLWLKINFSNCVLVATTKSSKQTQLERFWLLGSLAFSFPKITLFGKFGLSPTSLTVKKAWLQMIK